MVFFLLTSIFFTIRVDNMSLKAEHQSDVNKFDAIADVETKMLSSNLNTLGSIESLKNTFVSGNREKLYRESSVYFENLKNKFGVTHLYFIDKDGKVFLRAHDKKLYGDTITRLTFKKARLSGESVSGIELGKTGFALRVVMPYKLNNEIIGYIEIGEEINHFIYQLSKYSGSQYEILGSKKYLNQEDWENLVNKLKIDDKWEDYGEYVTVAETANTEDVDKCLTDLRPELFDAADYRHFAVDGRSVSCSSIPLKTVGGVQIGAIFVARDYSIIHNIYYTAEFWIVFAILVIFGASFVLIYLFIRQYLVRPISNTKDVIDKIVKTGDLSLSVPIITNDEIGQLGQSFNTMKEKIRNINDGLEDIVETRTADLQKFQMAVAGASDHIVITDPDGLILFANESVHKITGFEISEIIGKKAGSSELWGGEMGTEFYKKFWKTIKTDKKPFTGIVNNHRKNGEKYLALATVSPILDDKGGVAYFTGIERDVTEQYKAEENNQKLAAIVENTHDAVYGKTLDGVVTSWNHGAEKLYGYKGKEMIGKSVTLIVPEDKLTEFNHLMATVKSGRSISNLETQRLRKNGSLVDVSISASPIFNQNHAVIGVSIIGRDITKERQIDKAKTEFVSLASHQLRTPLSAINWYTEMLLDGDAGRINKEQKEYLEQVYRGNQRMVELVNSLLNVSRIDLGTFAVEPVEMRVEDVAKDFVGEIRPQVLAKKQKLVENYSAKLPHIFADPKLVRIVIQNLLTNAVKYTNTGGKIEITIRPDGKANIEIVVTDNGMGIPTGQQDKIFTKLFRADNVRATDTEGTGLGMYIVKSVVESMNGSISFKSKENQGTSFTVKLPVKGVKSRKGDKELT